MIHVYGFYPAINSFYLVYSQKQVKMTYKLTIFTQIEPVVDAAKF